ncbi:MAG: alpha/beta hydrolase [Janthinobacterium lividum]
MLAVSFCLLTSFISQLVEAAPRRGAVDNISTRYLSIAPDQGGAPALLPIYLSTDWSTPHPEITRAVVIIHGLLRNAATYFETGQAVVAAGGAAGTAAAAATTLVVAPQFLNTVDTRAHAIPAQVLRWSGNAWMGGAPAVGPVPITSYAALDAVLARLADRSLFPHLAHVAIIGHSGGAQVTQRYAIHAPGLDVLKRAGIDAVFVIASPSSYAYFDTLRAAPDGGFAPFDAATCADFDQWKYGMTQRPTPLSDLMPAQLESDYMSRQITYLVGGRDDDPQQAVLDRSCAAEAQGANRLARARNYFSYIRLRHPENTTQSFHIVPGVGHDGARMLTSTCAVATVFGTDACPAVQH